MFILILFCLTMISPKIIEAAPQCPSNATPNQLMSDPACYISTEESGSRWVDTSYTRTVSCGAVYAGQADYGSYYFYRCCRSDDGGCTDYYTGPWDGLWCDNGHGGVPEDSSWEETVTQGHEETYSDTVNTCHYISNVTSWSSCTSGMQYATGFTWSSVSGTSCSNVSLTRACCNTPSTSINIDGVTGTTNVTQESSFNVNWSFSNPGYEYLFTCTLNVPSPAGFVNDLDSQTVKTTASTILSGTLTDTIRTLANYSNASTQYTYTLTCTPTEETSACSRSSATVNTTVDAIDFSVDATPDGANYELGETVTWLATPHGGYPPYTYLWSGDISGTTQSIIKAYGFTGLRTAHVDATDNSGATSGDDATANIVDSRTPQ